MGSLYLTYRYAVSDLKLSLKIITKDAEISTESVIFWVMTCQNFIRQRHLKVSATGSYLSEYYGTNSLPVETDTIKKWINLPVGIYDLDNEKAIDYLILNTPGVPFSKCPRCTQTDANIIDLLHWNPYEKPSPSNPYFYRVGNQIFILGIENVAVPTVSLGVYGALDPRPIFLNPDSPLGINDEEYPQLKEMVMNLGRFVMVVPSNRTEQGDDARNESLKTFAKATSKEQDNPEE